MPVQPVQTIRNRAESGSAQYNRGSVGAHKSGVFIYRPLPILHRSEKWHGANSLA